MKRKHFSGLEKNFKRLLKNVSRKTASLLKFAIKLTTYCSLGPSMFVP